MFVHHIQQIIHKKTKNAAELISNKLHEARILTKMNAVSSENFSPFDIHLLNVKHEPIKDVETALHHMDSQIVCG